jgi:hypothetical protein
VDCKDYRVLDEARAPLQDAVSVARLFHSQRSTYSVVTNLNAILAANPEYLVYPLGFSSVWREQASQGGLREVRREGLPFSCPARTLSRLHTLKLGSSSVEPLLLARSTIFVAYFRRLISLYYGIQER